MNGTFLTTPTPLTFALSLSKGEREFPQPNEKRLRNMEKTPIHLTVLRKGDFLIIDLDEVGTLIPRSETHVESPFLQEVTAAVRRLATSGYGRSSGGTPTSHPPAPPSGMINRDLQQIGSIIFSHLLTESARTRLRTSEAVD